MLKNASIFILLVFCNLPMTAQESTLSVFLKNQSGKITEFHFEKADTAQLARKIIDIVQHNQLRGYFEARIDSINKSVTTWLAYIDQGPVYTWAKLDVLEHDDINSETSPIYRSGTERLEGESFDKQQVDEKLIKLLAYYENRGYPFAGLSFDSVVIADKQIYGRVGIEKGPFIKFDSLVITGSAKVDHEFLSAYLGVKYGTPYKQSQINQIAERLRQLRFLTLSDKPLLKFENDLCVIILPLEDRKVNNVDGVIGFLPNEQNEGQLLITGQLMTNLDNLFGKGGRLTLEWQRLRIASQLANINYYQPNVFASNWHSEFSFHLLREDSTFLRRSFRGGLGQQLSPQVLSFLHYENRFSSNLSLGHEAVHDFSINLLGLSFDYTNLNDALLPTSGKHIRFTTAAGKKDLLNIDQSGIDESVQSSVHWEAQLTAHHFLPLPEKWVIANKLEAATIINKQLFINDLYRLGGLNSIRGFNQNFFFATDYVLFSTEARLMLDPQSYLMLLSDQAVINRRTLGDQTSDWVLSFGAGMRFSTKAGIFSLIYALGRNENQPFDFNLSKIHFGYESRF